MHCVIAGGNPEIVFSCGFTSVIKWAGWQRIDKASVSNMSTLKQSRALRKKGKASESVNQSLVNQRKLAYNILKNLEDDILGDKEIPELEQCSECNNEILTRPPKAITILSCGHTFHRICIEKKLLLTMPNTCPFPDCGKNIDIIEPSNQESSLLSQSSGILALTNMMSERFILSSPVYQSYRWEKSPKKIMWQKFQRPRVAQIKILLVFIKMHIRLCLEFWLWLWRIYEQLYDKLRNGKVAEGVTGKSAPPIKIFNDLNFDVPVDSNHPINTTH